MNPIHKLLYEFVNKCVLSGSKRRNEATALDLAVMEMLDNDQAHIKGIHSVKWKAT